MESYVSPIPPLPGGWVKSTDDGTAEYRLAASLASSSFWAKKEYFPIRKHLEAVNVVPGNKSWVNWDAETRNEVVWHEGNITDVLCGMMKRRLLIAQKAAMNSWPDFAKLTAWPCDIAAFVEGRLDEKRFTELLWGLCLVNFSAEKFSQEPMPERPSYLTQQELPPAFYAQLKLCFARLPGEKIVAVAPIIFNLAATGDGERASRQALRRLHGSNVPITHISIPLSGEAARRCAAALLFPLWDSQLAAVCRTVAPDFFSTEQPETITI